MIELTLILVEMCAKQASCIKVSNGHKIHLGTDQPY